MNISEILKSAPKYLSSRYYSLSSYISDTLFPQDYKNRVFSKIKSKKEKREKSIRMKSLVDEASVLAFIFVTRKMFVEGSTASKNTVDILNELGVEKFCLGKTEFFGRNKNVILGDKLAQKLFLLLSEDVRKLLDVAYIYEIIDHYKKIRNIEEQYSYLFDQREAGEKLRNFFNNEKTSLFSFGNVVNQVFEAYTFASTIKWYQMKGWKVEIINPRIKGNDTFQLKFSTRGAPSRYSYALCCKGEEKCQIRHQLRVATKAYRGNNNYRANICCDIVILEDIDLGQYATDVALPNKDLISFGEVKHMSAFAELVASFIGMVHELKPDKLKRIRTGDFTDKDHIPPYLNVSGLLQHTARGVNETIEKRKYDVDIYHYEKKMVNI